MNKHILPIIASSLFLISGFAVAEAHAQSTSSPSSTLYSNAAEAGLNAHVLGEALNGYHWAKSHGDVHNSNILTVVDYTKPSTDKRLWVLNLNTNKVLMHALVAHGHNSGLVYANHFSNQNNSHETSLGVFTTGSSPFYGHDGHALKVHGLESGINSNAYARAIEIHGAQYVSNYDIKTYGRIGRTYGCFGVSPGKINKLIDYTKGGSVLFAYAPAENNDPIAMG
ncbi:MAG: hypothetical protein COB66_05170 [Coxiella sp. (in: Bacteria)]|nr:MAG: hypothetical protein COB66_05170 [Coxiella sp. (in: g-proteobacteria)]